MAKRRRSAGISAAGKRGKSSNRRSRNRKKSGESLKKLVQLSNLGEVCLDLSRLSVSSPLSEPAQGRTWEHQWRPGSEAEGAPAWQSRIYPRTSKAATTPLLRATLSRKEERVISSLFSRLRSSEKVTEEQSQPDQLQEVVHPSEPKSLKAGKSSSKTDKRRRAKIRKNLRLTKSHFFIDEDSF